MADGNALKESARRVQEALRAAGFSHEVVELAASTRTSAEAALAVGCDVAQIAKSLVFRLEPSGRPLLVIASGSHRVDEARIGSLVGERVTRADPDFVRQATGFVIGGVPPVGHGQGIMTLIDEALMEFDVIWAAAGHPHALFQLNPRDLEPLTGGRVVGVS